MSIVLTLAEIVWNGSYRHSVYYTHAVTLNQ